MASPEAFKAEPTQADLTAFERLLTRMDDAELRGLMLYCELYVMKRRDQIEEANRRAVLP